MFDCHPNLSFSRIHQRGGQKNTEVRIKQPTNFKTTEARQLPAVPDRASTFLVQQSRLWWCLGDKAGGDDVRSWCMKPSIQHFATPPKRTCSAPHPIHFFVQPHGTRSRDVKKKST